MGVDYDFWLMFFGVSIALNAAPGPDVLYIVTKTISSGKNIWNIAPVQTPSDEAKPIFLPLDMVLVTI